MEYIATIVIEPRSLVREALVSLMASHSYQVVGGVASTADIENSSLVADAPRLVILGPLPADEAASAAGSIRKLWPDTKIILLFDRASPVDFQTLLASEIDGCIPLFASPDTLVGTLQQIIAADLRILVLKTETSLTACPTGGQEGDDLGLTSNSRARSDDAENGSIDRTISRRIPHGLSEREEEILKGVVRGHSNKMIARTCGVTDATIKVHMKSILRKIRVANRTQAAIWALEQGYGADANRRSPALRALQGEVAA
ncbi:response regulator transcription factor [Reyranella soli]|uniref:Transcriptional regulator n=1 Tax=Reyranella soli TaxID=1230389 RepID=A0A512NR59_9HYPH|nr:response regulator transcription factor [Reyranella soli]GEP61419.1 transcriptional regulator [Reyranella soli]